MNTQEICANALGALAILAYMCCFIVTAYGVGTENGGVDYDIPDKMTVSQALATGNKPGMISTLAVATIAWIAAMWCTEFAFGIKLAASICIFAVSACIVVLMYFTIYAHFITHSVVAIVTFVIALAIGIVAAAGAKTQEWRQNGLIVVASFQGIVVLGVLINRVWPHIVPMKTQQKMSPKAQYYNEYAFAFGEILTILCIWLVAAFCCFGQQSTKEIQMNPL